MKNGTTFYPLSAQIKDTVAKHGEYEAARILRKRIDFTTYFMLRFAKAPIATKG